MKLVCGHCRVSRADFATQCKQAEEKDNEADVYRVFRRLSARKLLYPQSELMKLEAYLADTYQQDALEQREARPGDIQEIDDRTTRWQVYREERTHTAHRHQIERVSYETYQGFAFLRSLLLAEIFIFTVSAPEQGSQS